MAARQQIVIELVDKVSRSLGNIENRLKSLDGNTQKLNRSFGGAAVAAKLFVGALAVREIVQFGQKIAEISDKFQRYENQLSLITNGQEELDATMNLLTQTAIANRSSFADTVDLYSKLSLATQDLGVSQDQLVRVTSNFSRALAISGADANTASGAIRQFGQAMASGTVRGDEFNSIVEALGPALNIMAQESGINIGRLREMSQAGELTAETFFAMIENSKSLNAAFEETEITIGQLAQQTEDAFDRMINRMDEAVGASSFIKQEIKDLGRAFDFLAGTETAPVNMTNQQLADFANNNITASQALEELNNRLALVSITGQHLGGIFREDARQFEELNAIIAEVTRQMEEAKAALEGAAAGGDGATQAMTDLDLAMAALKPYEGLIKKVADTDSLYELGDAITQAEMDLNQLQRAQRALREVMNESNEVTLEQLTQMRGLTEAIIVAEAELKELNRQADDDAMKQFAQKVSAATQNLNQYENIVASAMTEQQRMSNEIAEAERYLAELNTAAREGGDAMAAALAPAIDTVSQALGLMRSELANVGNELSGFDRYYKDLIDNANKTANETVYAVQAQQQLKEQLDAGIISIDVYAAAMERFTTSTKTTTGATRDYINELEQLENKYTEVLGNQIELLERNAAREIEQLKEIAAARPELAQQAAQIELAIEKQLANDKIAEARRVADAQKKIYNDQFRIFESGKYAELDLSKMTEDQKTKFALDAGRSALAGLAQHNKRAFQLNKALMIAEAVINVATGVTKALAQGGIFGPLLAGAIVAAGAVQIATIRNMQYQGRAAGGEMTVGRPTVVGEAGPEIVVPKQPSVVMPNSVAERLDAMGAGNGGGPVTVNFNITTLDAKDFDTLLIERRSVISGIVNDAMQRRGRQGVLT